MPYLYAGIDEAGYGPMFGPFVTARAVFSLDAANGKAVNVEPPGPDHTPPDLWQRLERAICRKPRDRRKRIAVNDSKKLYSPATGPGHLERGVLAFLRLAGHRPASLDELLAAVGHDEHARIPDLLWYHDERGHPALPVRWDAGQLGIAASTLARAADAASLALPSLAAAVVYEDRFNHIIEQTRSKARCAWTFIAQHLWAIWQEHGEHDPWVVVDRQGGRRVYHELLQMMFEGAELRLIDESNDVSRYRVRAGRRAMTVSFEASADARHLPVALASMTAKYCRELLMERFNNFWRHHLPAVKPTAGYVQDGRRFLAEIDPVIQSLGIDRRRLIRQR